MANDRPLFVRADAAGIRRVGGGGAPRRFECRKSGPLYAATVMLAGCSGGGGSDATPESSEAVQSSSTSPLATTRQYSNATAQANIQYAFGFLPRDYSSLPVVDGHISSQVSIIAIGGAAAGDCDDDGYVDVFIARGDAGPNLLYMNQGNLAFVDRAAEAGLAYTKSAGQNHAHSGPTFADMDGDGDLDLFLGGVLGDPSKIFRNDGGCAFTDVTAGSGMDTLESRHTISAAFGDYDLDGDLDLFLSHWGTPRDQTDPGDTENLWRNVGGAGAIRFESVSEAARISPTIITLDDPKDFDDPFEFTFTPTFARINDDLYPDVLSVADFNESMVFINNKDGTFTNATNVGVIVDNNGMGSALGDYDGDGDLDWFVSSIYAPNFNLSNRMPYPVGNRLYRNDGGAFSDVSEAAGVENGGWGWGACFLDFENDGDLDIYHTNGWPFPFVQTSFARDVSRAFVSDGAGKFVERAIRIGVADDDDGRGVVCADLDNDGDTDVLQLHMRTGASATLWRNDTSGNTYLRVRLRGNAPNTEAAGARVRARIGVKEQMREIVIGSNFISQNPTMQIFGLGSASNVDELRIEWPDGCVVRHFGVVAQQTFVANQSDCVP